jgi:sensor histidine kinase YesM
MKNDRIYFLEKSTNPYKLLLVSFVIALFVIYPNIACFSWDLNHMDRSEHTAYISFFVFRLIYFTLLILLLTRYNLQKIDTPVFIKRLFKTILITVIAYLFYVCVSYLSSSRADCFTGLLLFQFFVACIICAFLGYATYLITQKKKKEKEIEHLKIENLQSRCDALTNQINPHFFFNSLNGLTSLIRKKNEENALEYVNKMSDVFRYILQSDKKGLVTLGEEMEFVKAFFYMMEIRFANKLVFSFNIPDENKVLKLPVLSLLPVIDNVVVHNQIDSEHKMEVCICLSRDLELSVSNPLYPKLSPPNTNGTGLKNLENRFLLLMNKQIRVSNDGKRFTVYLPMKNEKDENTYS